VGDAEPALGLRLPAARAVGVRLSADDVESTPSLPPLAARLRGVQSSPVREILALTERPGMISFAGGLPAPELFDATGLAAAFAEALAGAAAGRSLQYSTTEGDPALRAAVAARLTARGLPTHAGELLITSGSQQALTLIATVLLEPGDVVLVEEPSYLAALQAFKLAGATVVPMPCDDDGQARDIAKLASELRLEHGLGGEDRRVRRRGRR
jgi:DNA-binding transcriptional MocR family regulator